MRYAPGRLLAASGSVAACGLAYRLGHARGLNDARDPQQEWEAEAASLASLKTELLDHLRYRSYVRLAPSCEKGAGVGVFAVIDIPAGVDPFCTPNASLRGHERSVNISLEELRAAGLPPAVVNHVLDFHAVSGGTVGVSATAMAAMDASWYLNHSYDAPNVRAVPPDDHGGFTSYCTSRPVRAGDELFLDYRLDLPSLYTKIENERRQWQ